MKDFNLETFVKELESKFMLKMEIIEFNKRHKFMSMVIFVLIGLSWIVFTVAGVLILVLGDPNFLNVLSGVFMIALGVFLCYIYSLLLTNTVNYNFRGVVFKDYEKTWETAYVTTVPNKRATVLIDCFANINIKLNELDYVFKKSETQSIDYITLFVNLYGVNLSLSVPLSQLEKVNDNSKVRVNLELTVEQFEDKFKAISYKASLEELIVD